MKLKRKLPPDRTVEQLRNHYEVEKELARKLLAAPREERKAIFATMYDELYRKVPEHSRRSGTVDPQQLLSRNRQKAGLVERLIDAETVFVEFAPGDCTFAYYICPLVRKVLAIDITDHRSPGSDAPGNFSLEIYNGYNLSLDAECADIVFSDQFIEHLHPEDVGLHFSLAQRLLKKGGRYIFRTPHAFFGPWDISRFFSDTPEGFHLKEWTFTGLNAELKKAGFTRTCGMKRFKKNYAVLPMRYLIIIEPFLKMVPRMVRRSLSRLFIPMQLVMVAEK